MDRPLLDPSETMELACIMLAKMKAPIGLLEYAIDPIAQNRLQVVACASAFHATKRARQSSERDLWERFRNYGLHSGDKTQPRLCRK